MKDPLWNCWPQMQTLSNGSIGELYLRVIVAFGFSSRWREGSNQRNDSSNSIHHFCSTYGIGKEILDLRANKLNQDLEKI